jgi:hypothetical protein
VTRVRNSTRALLVVSGVPLTALLAAPALADSVPTTSYDAGPGLTVTQTLGLFVGIPALVILTVYVLVFALTGRRGPRYPVGAPWSGAAQWFGGPADPSSAVQHAEPTQGAGGARAQW